MCRLNHVWLFATLWASILCPWNLPGKNTRVCCFFLLQGIFMTQRVNPRIMHLLHWQEDSLPLCHLRLTLFWLNLFLSIFSFWCYLIPWTEEPDRLQSMGSQRVRHDWSNLACTHSHSCLLLVAVCIVYLWHSFTFHLSVVLNVKWVSCRKHIIGSPLKYSFKES